MLNNHKEEMHTLCYNNIIIVITKKKKKPFNTLKYNYIEYYFSK